MNSINALRVDALKWDEHGLITAVVQDASNGAVLMVAWMNAASVAETLATGRVCYWSRSRQQLWRKGESSGHTIVAKDIQTDCDGDTLLLSVDPAGAACHTGAASCFFRSLEEVLNDHA